MPKRFEVWFLSIDKTTWLDSVLKINTKPQLYTRALQCQPMGEYCFDPQIGLYKRDEASKAQEEVDLAEVNKLEKYDFLDPHKGAERSMIECDENSSFFDVFCGKAKKAKKLAKSKLEVWVDISSTMKQVDFDGFENDCKRLTFLDNLKISCPLNEKMKVYFFEEYKKEAGSLDRVCLSGGLNDMKRMMKDIRNSDADNIIMITDIYEADSNFIDAIEMTGRGRIKGLDKPMYAKDLKSELSRVKAMCK